MLLTGVLTLLLAAFLPQSRQTLCAWTALLGLVIGGGLCAHQLGTPARLGFSGVWAIDGAGIWARLLIVAATAVALVSTPGLAAARPPPWRVLQRAAAVDLGRDDDGGRGRHAATRDGHPAGLDHRLCAGRLPPRLGGLGRGRTQVLPARRLRQHAADARRGAAVRAARQQQLRGDGGRARRSVWRAFAAVAAGTDAGGDRHRLQARRGAGPCLAARRGAGRAGAGCGVPDRGAEDRRHRGTGPAAAAVRRHAGLAAAGRSDGDRDDDARQPGRAAADRSAPPARVVLGGAGRLCVDGGRGRRFEHSGTAGAAAVPVAAMRRPTWPRSLW